MLGMQTIASVVSILFLRLALVIDSKSRVTIVYAIARSLATVFYILMIIHLRHKVSSLDIAFVVIVGLYLMFESVMSSMLVTFYNDAD